MPLKVAAGQPFYARLPRAPRAAPGGPATGSGAWALAERQALAARVGNALATLRGAFAAQADGNDDSDGDDTSDGGRYAAPSAVCFC